MKCSQHDEQRRHECEKFWVSATPDGAEDQYMENQHRKITGYRELNQQEIDLMNEIKAHFAATGELIKKVNAVNTELRELTSDAAANVDGADAFRWASIAKTHAQEASMALTRAVAKPEFF